VLKNLNWFNIAMRRGLSGSEKTLLKFGRTSLELYNDFFKEESVEVDLIKGVLGVYMSSEQARETARSLNGRYMDGQEVVEAGFKDFGGGVLFENELSINPAKLLPAVAKKVREMGTRMIEGEVTALRAQNRMVGSAVVNDEELQGDAFVITSGAWAGQLCRSLQLNPMVLPARGLAMIFDCGGTKVARYPALFEDYGIGLTQHNESTVRVTSFFDFVGFKDAFREKKKKWMMDVVERHLTEHLKLKQVEEGVGYRPCTPDQLPVIGKVPGYANAYVATGNCRLGITLAPATGQMIKSMVDGEVPRNGMTSDFDPARFLTS
jgi:D-amino-acid dehydrogenase